MTAPFSGMFVFAIISTYSLELNHYGLFNTYTLWLAEEKVKIRRFPGHAVAPTGLFQVCCPAAIRHKINRKVIFRLPHYQSALTLACEP
jgi:hypothetical protein